MKIDTRPPTFIIKWFKLQLEYCKKLDETRKKRQKQL